MRTWIWLLLLVFTAVAFYVAGVVDERSRNRDYVRVPITVRSVDLHFSHGTLSTQTDANSRVLTEADRS